MRHRDLPGLSHSLWGTETGGSTAAVLTLGPAVIERRPIPKPKSSLHAHGPRSTERWNGVYVAEGRMLRWRGSAEGYQP